MRQASAHQSANCIHPGQVKILDEEYSRLPEEVAAARDLITRNEAKAEGRGSFPVESGAHPRATRRHRAPQRATTRIATAGAGDAP